MICVAAAISGALSAAPARAQVFSVPQELEGVVAQPEVQPEGRRAIQEFAAPRLRDLQSATVRAIGAARDELIAPLVAAETVSVSFRLTYAEALMPVLERLAGAPDEARAVSAIRIAGHIGTGQSLALLIDAADAPRPALRYAAAMALGDTLRLIAESNPALQEDAGQRIIDDLARRIAQEPAPLVLDALVRAIDAGRANPTLRDASILALTSALREQIADRRAALDAQTPLAPALGAMVRAVVNARGLFIDRGAGVPEPVAVGAGLMTGHAMTYALKALRVRGGFNALTSEERRAAGALLKAAEAVAALASVSAGLPNVSGQPISGAVDDQNLAALESAVQAWTGPSGRLTRRPFNADPADFR